MAKDEAIRNQKVFVRLDNVLALQSDYLKAVEAQRRSESENDVIKAHQRSRIATFEEVIRTLQLPIKT